MVFTMQHTVYIHVKTMITLNLNGFTKLKIYSAVVVLVEHGITTHFQIKNG